MFLTEFVTHKVRCVWLMNNVEVRSNSIATLQSLMDLYPDPVHIVHQHNVHVLQQMRQIYT